MLTPRYFFADDFRLFQAYFLSQPHTAKTFQKGDYLWQPGAPYEKIHYILSGTAVHFANHENGRRKLLSFHGPGTVFPGYRQNDYKIELSLATAALSEMRVLEFTVSQFQAMFESNGALQEQVIQWYSMYINRLLFETVHQEYNSSLIKLCNLLYLLATNGSAHPIPVLDLTQDELAELLGLSRVQITRGLAALRKQKILATSRGKISVLDLPQLQALCSSEALNS